jgi:hypothetical protein
MRLLIVILVLVLLVVVDQFRFRGYYTSQVSYYLAQAVRSVI